MKPQLCFSKLQTLISQLLYLLPLLTIMIFYYHDLQKENYTEDYGLTQTFKH